MSTKEEHEKAAATEEPTTTTIDTADLPQDKEEDQSGDRSQAFNPETGEINWDCPCLGGMAHGTCGEEFKAAFSCFVYSEEEPKGMDCIESFKAMQDCFRAHPEEYASELQDDDEGEETGNETDKEVEEEEKEVVVTKG